MSEVLLLCSTSEKGLIEPRTCITGRHTGPILLDILFTPETYTVGNSTPNDIEGTLEVLTPHPRPLAHETREHQAAQSRLHATPPRQIRLSHLHLSGNLCYSKNLTVLEIACVGAGEILLSLQHEISTALLLLLLLLLMRRRSTTVARIL